MKGFVIKLIGGKYTVKTETGIVECKPLGIFRHRNFSPKVGDRVIVEKDTIVKVEDRVNDLIRPNVANIDKVFVITSVVEPDLNLNLLDRLISMIEWMNIKIVLVFTKVDLVSISTYKNIFDYYENLGYKIYFMPTDKEKIVEEVNDNICVVAGQSGVGKSTMINLFDSSFKIKTDGISKALGRGKHTTRHTELLSVGSGYIADTPGFGTLDLEMDLPSLAHSFREFFETKCKFNTCLHIKEPGCKVKEKVKEGQILQSRYDNYLLFASEINSKKKY